MKTPSVLLLIFFLSAGLFTSCDKGQIYPAAPGLSATVNNINWATNSVVAITSGNQINISASKPDGGTLAINIPENIAAGTYALTQNGPYTAIYTNETNSALNNYYSISGTLVIVNSPPGEFKGTFSFTAANILNSSDIITVNNGIFSVNYNPL